MSFLTLAKRHHGCSVELPGGDQDCLERFLQKPKRTMAALLSRERMTPLGQGRFLYQSRPFRLLQFEITPVVVFQAVWQHRCLRIDFEDCQLKGLGSVQEAVRFECRAVLTPSDQRLDAEATAALAIAESHPLQRLPRSVMEALAAKALGLVFVRLERRCQGGLRRAMERWIQAEAAVQGAGDRGIPRVHSRLPSGLRRHVVDQDEQTSD